MSINFVDKKVEDKYICQICQDVLNDAIMINAPSGSCGHNFCRECIRIQFSDYKLDKCPTCQARFSMGNLVPDLRLQREIKDLKVYCTFKEKECKWIGSYGDLKMHTYNCTYSKVKCAHCELMIKTSESKEHDAICPKAPLGCPYNIHGCFIKIPREALDEHSKSCRYKKQKCPYGAYASTGSECTALLSMDDFERHMEQRKDEHINIIFRALKKCEAELKRMPRQVPPISPSIRAPLYSYDTVLYEDLFSNIMNSVNNGL